MSRRADRRVVVEVLYAADVRGVTPEAITGELEKPPGAYASGLLEAVARMRGEIDELLGQHARGWSLERMSAVDRNVLRVATAELLEAQVPPGVAVSEAVAIAKHFSGQEAARFVNGVLGAIKHTVESRAAARD